jgi:hypothetical protein
MFFDFRRGVDRWPKGVELLSPAMAASEVAKGRETLQKERKATKSFGPEPRSKYSAGFGSDDLYGKGKTGPASSSDEDSDASDDGPLETWPEDDGREAGDEAVDEAAEAEARMAAAEQAAAEAEARLFSPAPSGGSHAAPPLRAAGIGAVSDVALI